jgi:flagellin
MSLMINQNITSLNAWRNLNKTDRSMSATMEKLSSGLRINRAADDPSGLVTSEQMRAQVVGLKAAIKNSEKGISMIQTAEAALDKVHGLLDKLRGLALDSANVAANDDNMLTANQAEVRNILDTITRISDNTQYGTKKLLDGTNDSTNPLVFQIGANQNQTVQISIQDVAADQLATGVVQSRGSGFGSLDEIDVTTADGATDSLALIDAAIDQVSVIRGDLGAFQANTLEANLDSLRVAAENLQASESVVRDADMAAEMAEFTKFQIMLQAGTAMLAQANQIPNNILQLLR